MVMNIMNKLMAAQATIQKILPVLSKIHTIRASRPPPIIALSIHPFILSVMNVFTVVLLKPYFSSITNVLYIERV